MLLPTTPYVRILGGDTECPLQVCQLSRSSESIHFRSLRGGVAIFNSTRLRAPDGFWLLRSEARASDLFPDYLEYKTPTLSYEIHPNEINSDNYRPFEAVSQHIQEEELAQRCMRICNVYLPHIFQLIICDLRTRILVVVLDVNGWV